MIWNPDLMASDVTEYTALVRDVAHDLLEKGAAGYIQGKTDAINTMWADFGEELAGECPPNPHAGGAPNG